MHRYIQILCEGNIGQCGCGLLSIIRQYLSLNSLKARSNIKCHTLVSTVNSIFIIQQIEYVKTSPSAPSSPPSRSGYPPSISATVARIQKIQKTRCIYFRILVVGGPSPPSQLVPNPFNWSPNTVFTDISATVAQIQKIQKTRCIFFRILLLGGPSPPSQLVPNPFNWSPNTVFCRYLGNGRSNPKNSKNEVHLFWNFGSGRTHVRCVRV